MVDDIQQSIVAQAAGLLVVRSPSPPVATATRNDSYVFLVQHTSPTCDDPVDADDAKNDKYAHTRSKRKRTSQQDLVVLEEAYLRQPRPDRTMRNELVQRVALNDKELSIWFQNRRQMTRRKAKIWQPNAITDIIRRLGHDDAKEGDEVPEPELNDTPSSQDQTDEPRSSQPRLSPGATAEQSFRPPLSSAQSQALAEAALSADLQEIEAEQCPKTSPVVATAGRESSSGPDAEPAEIMDVTLLREVCAVEAPQQQRQILPNTNTPRKLKRTSSVRLSMSLEGKAEVLEGGNTPSPPRKLLTPAFSNRQGGLLRSQSNVSLLSTTSLTAGNSSPFLPTSRSHMRASDHRTWEFYCDKEARNALTKTAECEQNGSAASAIRLIRAGSAGRAPLTPLAGQKAQVQSVGSGKRKAEAREEGKKATRSSKLSRTTSSFARLESNNSVASEKLDAKAKKIEPDTSIWQEPDGDSDKENWYPGGTDIAQRRPRAFHPSVANRTPHRVLGENIQVPSQASSLNALMDRENAQARKRRPVKHKVDGDKENSVFDAEVASFMGEEEDLSPRKRDDLAAVQNLLSLSQGAWR